MSTIARFALGKIVSTPGALGVVTRHEIIRALARHALGDWGDLDKDDRRANEDALKVGARLLSAYETPAGVKFWVITEADRSATTVLLPEEY